MAMLTIEIHPAAIVATCGAVRRLMQTTCKRLVLHTHSCVTSLRRTNQIEYRTALVLPNHHWRYLERKVVVLNDLSELKLLHVQLASVWNYI